MGTTRRAGSSGTYYYGESIHDRESIASLFRSRAKIRRTGAIIHRAESQPLQRLQMAQPDPFAAQILETSAGGLAGFSSSLLAERHPEVVADGVSTREWRGHLAQRVLELAAAVRSGEPELFVARAQWMRTAARARDQDEAGLRASLECLKETLREQLPSSAIRSVDPHLDAALHAFDEPVETRASELDPESDSGRLALRFLERSLEGDARQAIQLLVEAVEDGLAVRDAYLDVLMAAQREVGRLWHQGELGVSEEHLVTATTKRAMAVLCQLGTAPDPVGKTVVSASVAGNVHDLGTRVVADFFELAGWRSVCLGADVPSPEVAVAATYFDADLVVLGATLSTQLKATAETIEAVREQNEGVPILVGGLAFEDAAETWKSVGADAKAGHPEEAVEVGAQLVAER